MPQSQSFPGVVVTEAHLLPLQRLAAIMCAAVAIGGALAELAVAWAWLTPGYVEAFVAPHIGLAPGTAALDGLTRFIGFGISMVPLAVLFYALHQAYELFDAYRRGDIFSTDAPKRLRRIGMSMLMLALLRPATSALLSLALTASNAPGERMLVIGISIEDYMIALFGGLILAIGHVLLEASRIADEHRQII